MQIGIVGLPYSGKTTFFQTLTETRLDAAAYQKREPNVATVKVPDERLDKLSAIFNPKKKINAAIEIVDMVGMQKGDASSGTFAANYISKIKTNDALICVVRAFEDESVPSLEGSIDPVRDAKTVEEEFLLADMAFVENRLEKLASEIKKPNRKEEAQKEIEIMNRWNEALQNEIPIRELELSEEERLLIKNYQPLTAKPLLIAINFDERDIDKAPELVKKAGERLSGKNIKIEPFFAKIELELSQLDDDEREMFMKEYGVEESALSRLIRGAYELLGLRSFFTVGEDECRAWTIKKGTTAQDAAGVIHTDFRDKFIRAEVVAYDDFITRGSFAKCKEDGVFRLEGKDYVVQDGDILHVRHG